MTGAWDGRPENPERDGWHWLHHPEDLRPMVAAWNAELGGWVSGALHSPQGVVDLGFRYLGPALFPAEVAAREAAAAEAMREACAAICARHVEPNIARAADKVAAGVGAMAMVARDTIRALPIPAADALARALDQARAEVAAERDEMWNRIQRVQEHLSLPVDCTAQRIIEAIEDLRAGEREACASIEVRVTVPDGADEWSPLEAWEEALAALDTEFRAAIRARGKGKETEG